MWNTIISFYSLTNNYWQKKALTVSLPTVVQLHKLQFIDLLELLKINYHK